MIFHTARLATEKAVIRPALPLCSMPGISEMHMASKPTYSELLKDPRWQRKRLEILNRDEFRCQACMDSESTLHVHHKHYVKGRLPWEYEEFELVTLCESCHGDVDESELYKKILLAKLAADGPYSENSGLAMIAGWANNRCGHDLSDWYERSPYSFVLGEVADLMDTFHWKMDQLCAFRDALSAIPYDKRELAVRELNRIASEMKGE